MTPSMHTIAEGGAIAVACPSCGSPASAAGPRADGGFVAAGRMDAATLRAQSGCDLSALSAAITRALVARLAAAGPPRKAAAGA